MNDTPTPRPARSQRGEYRIFRAVSTRWSDNDAYGHVNNAVHYTWFDTAVNAWLVEAGVLVPGISPVIALVAETSCSYFESVNFPETVEIGLAVARIGHSSATYSLGIFRQNGIHAAAQGLFTHVHVDRALQRPVAIPDATRVLMEAIRHPQEGDRPVSS